MLVGARSLSPHHTRDDRFLCLAQAPYVSFPAAACSEQELVSGVHTPNSPHSEHLSEHRCPALSPKLSIMAVMGGRVS